MNIKEYKASSMAEAYRMVRADLGDEAIIIGSRNVKEGGFMGIGAKRVIILQATNDKMKVRSRLKAKAPRRRSDQLRKGQAADPAAKPKTAHGHQLLKELYNSSESSDAVKRAVAEHIGNEPAAQVNVSQQAAQQNSAPRTAANAAAGVTGQPLTPRASHPEVPQPAAPAVSGRDVSKPAYDPKLSHELTEIRAMVRSLMKQSSNDAVSELPETLFNQYLALLEQEVSEELAEQIINDLHRTMDRDQFNNVDRVKDEMRKMISRYMPSCKALNLDSKTADGRPKTVALIGPTGVGKTTTLAKLAATFKLKEDKSVALITIDTYRIGAVDQLQEYAQIIGLPLHVVKTPQDMANALKQLQHVDVVLIDTAGRSQRDHEKLDELNEFIDIANPHEVHLVLSSTSSQRVVLEAAERFSQLRVDGVIFTKLDEAVNFGVVLNTIDHVKKKLSYVTTGQDVPNCIEAGDSDRIAALILGESLS